MPTPDAFRWFKTTFAGTIEPAVAGTPFTLDLLAAIAAQETGHIWGTAPRHAPAVGACSRSASATRSTPTKGARRFPGPRPIWSRARAATRCFGIAHDALVKMAAHVPGVRRRRERPEQVLPRLRHLPVRPAVLQDGSRLLPRAAVARLRCAPGEVPRGAAGARMQAHRARRPKTR